MRILFLTPFLPDPVANHGGGRYVGCLAAAMAKHADVGLVHLSHPGETAPGDACWSWRRELPYLGAPPPQARLAHRLKLLWRWRRDPLLAAKHWHPAMPTLLADARREFAPDVLMVEMAQMAQYLPFVPGVPTVLTDHEAGVPANHATGLGAAADRRDRRMWQAHLRRMAGFADVVQALTREDADALTAVLGRPVEVRPPALTLPATVCRPETAPRRALFLGDFRHQPNRDAVARIVAEVLPALRRRCPDAELWIAGGNEAPIRHLAAAPAVRVCGFVPDLAALLAETRVVLAPLWTGAGFRVKAATALAHGIPVVTNALGARGLTAPAPACAIAETAEDLAAACARLLDDTTLAADAGRTARTWAERHLDPAHVAGLQLERLRVLLATRAGSDAERRP